MPDVEDDSNSKGVSPEDHDNKLPPPEVFDSDNIGNSGAASLKTTHLERVSKPYDCGNNFLDLYGNMNLVNINVALCLRLYCHDKELNLHLGAGINYSNNYFSDGVTVTNMSVTKVQ